MPLSPPRSRQVTLTVTLLVLALSAVACGGDQTSKSTKADPRFISKNPIDTTGLNYADDQAVHLDDGTSLETDGPVGAYVLAGDGAWFVTDDDLKIATAEGVVDTGLHADANELLASEDGRYLAFIDATTGTKDEYGTVRGTAVALDLTTGKEIVRSDYGMGDLDTDLADLYEDAGGPSIYGLVDGVAYFTSPDGVFAYDLTTGKRTTLGDLTDLSNEDWYLALNPTADPTPDNPSGTWSFEDPSEFVDLPVLISSAGKRVPTTARQALTWTLTNWLDDQTAIGFAVETKPQPSPSGVPPIEDPDPEPVDGVILLTCKVPTGACTILPGTEEGVTLPNGGWQL